MFRKMVRKSQIFKLLACLLVIGGTAVGTVFYLFYKPSRVFDAVRNVVNAHYYDRTFNGYDWVKVGQTFRAKLPWWDSNGSETTEVVNSMLRLLESSHLDYKPPYLAKFLIGSEPGLGLVFPDSMEMAGLSVIGLGHGKTPTLLEIEQESSLYKHGARVGDHAQLILAQDKNGKRVVLYRIINRAGITKEFVDDIPPRDMDPAIPYVDNGRIIFNKFDEESFVALNELRKDPGNADIPVVYRPLGIVTTLGQTTDQLRVIDVQKGSVADQEGIEIGSTLRGMNSLPTQDGKDGIALTLSLPNGEERKFEAKVPTSYIKEWQPYHRSAELVGTTLVIRFDKFSDEDVDWVGTQLKRQGSGPLILDLRNNSGGTVKSTQRFLGYFLPAGTMLVEQRRPTGAEALRVSDGGSPVSDPLAVLVGPASASAAEICAATLQAHSRATVVGRKTSGDVLLARTYGLPNGGLIEVPEASLRDAKGRDLEGYGLTPDIMVWKTLATIREGRDLPLETALALVTGAASPPAAIPQGSTQQGAER